MRAVSRGYTGLTRRFRWRVASFDRQIAVNISEADIPIVPCPLRK